MFHDDSRDAEIHASARFSMSFRIEDVNSEYLENYSKYLAYARMFTVSKQHAEDLVQQAFSNIIQHLNRGKNIEAETVGAYIKSVIRNVSITQHRKNSLTPHLRIVEEDEKSVEEIHQMSEQSRTIIGLISELSPSQKAILIMYYFDGLKIDEIARDLNLSSNTVNTHLRRGKKQLEKHLVNNELFKKDVS